MNKPMTFSKQEFEDFFGKIKTEWINKEVEYGIFEGYEKSKVLIVAPHAGLGKVRIKIGEKEKEVKVGDANTDKLAKIAAYNIGGAFLISYVPRIVADFARKPEDLGKGLRVNYLVSGKRRAIEIHKDKSYKPLLEKFHEIIESLNPRFILSFHGTILRNFDALLGFGERGRYMGGWKNAMKFKEAVLEKLESFGVNARVGVSRVYVGRVEANLNMHTQKRKGCLVEFSSRGRVDFPKKEYQILAASIAEVAKRWNERKEK